MPPPTRARLPALTSDVLHAVIQDAINRADVDAFLDAHDDAAVVPPDGRPFRGRDDIRAAIEPLLALAPEMTTVVVKKLRPDETWRIVLDDPLASLSSLACAAKIGVRDE